MQEALNLTMEFVKDTAPAAAGTVGAGTTSSATASAAAAGTAIAAGGGALIASSISGGGSTGFAGSAAGANAAQYWANQTINSNNTWYQNMAYSTMGHLASLWTPETSEQTFTILAGGYGSGIYAERPYWRYLGGDAQISGSWITRGWGWEPPYKSMVQAKDALQLEHVPYTIVKTNIPWYKPVIGPRSVEGNPAWGNGGGMEYYKGWKFPW